MGVCGTKSKDPKGKKKSTADKYQEKETNDNNHADLEDYVIPPDFESKMEFLCSQKFNKHLRMRSSDTNFFYKIIVESNVTNCVDLEKGITYVRDKIKQKNEQIVRNVDNKGSTCIQVFSEYYNKIKDYDYKGLLAMMLQEKCTDNQIPPLMESVFSISVKCYQIVLTILLCSDQDQIERWWNINKDNTNITEEFFLEIKEFNKSLSLKNEQHQQIISMLVSRRTTQQKAFLTDEQIKQANLQFNSQYDTNKKDEDLLKDIATNYLTNLYGDIQKTLERNNQFKKTTSNEAIGAGGQSTNRSITKQESVVPEQLKNYVSTYLPKLYNKVYNEIEFTENITDEDQENDHQASACMNYSIGLQIKKKQMYLTRKD